MGQLRPDRPELRTKGNAMTPEDCILVAHWTGDGWALTVEDESGNCIAYLQWPNSLPETMTKQQLEEKGFEVV